MKRLACLFLALLFVLAGCGGGGSGGGGFPVIANPTSPPPKPAPAAGACTVVVYGDSIMAGQGIEAYVESRRPKWQVEDRAVGGTALLALSGVFHSQPRSARIVVLENGAIDAWMGVPVSTVLATYSAMVDTIRAEGRVPIVTGYAHQRLGALDAGALARRDEHDGALKTFMLERGVAFVDLGAVAWSPDEANLPDSMHPGPEYSARLADRLLSTLDRVAPECQP